MRRKITFLVFLGMCFLIAVLLSKAAQMLDQRKHPLLSSLTCIETADLSDLYWKINQIHCSGTILPNKRGIRLTLENNIPNFDSYFFRIDRSEHWQQSRDGQIQLDGGEGTYAIEIRATNILGGKVPPRMYTVRVIDGVLRIVPDDEKIESARFSFRFEKPGSAKVRWLSELTRPLTAPCPDQWNTFLVLRTWVGEQIPNRDPSMKSRWDAQRILQAVWNDPSLGFICDAFAATYVSACASSGLQARMIHLGDEHYNGHYAAEIWSDQHNKWIFMDPLYDCHFMLLDTPLSAIELHHLWIQGRMGEVSQHGREGSVVKKGLPSRDYANLFQDIQMVNSNDFLTTPFSSVMDILTLKIRFLRYVDKANPPYNRVKLAYNLFFFHYLPIFMSGLIIPFFIPAVLIYLIIAYGRQGQ